MEIFNTFNELFDKKKYIIMTSDRTPSDIDKLEDRLQSRFSSGLVAPISPPDYEICCIILQKRAEKMGITLPKDVVDYIASHINTNVRDLEGAVIKLSFHNSHIKNEILEVAKAKDILKELFVSQKSTLNIDKIQDIVSDYFNIPKDMLLNKTRTKEIAEARAFAMYICTTIS